VDTTRSWHQAQAFAAVGGQLGALAITSADLSRQPPLRVKCQCAATFSYVCCLWPGLLCLSAVEFEDQRDAEDAVRGMDGRNGWKVEFARSAGPKPAYRPGGGEVGAKDGGISILCLPAKLCRVTSGNSRAVMCQKCHMLMQNPLSLLSWQDSWSAPVPMSDRSTH
jgi:hypothetical protein